jgi:hypothetical protein
MNYLKAYRRRLGGLMVALLNLKNRTILPILCLGFVLIAWTCPSYAALLKDIRVGEYETHTRIVFEHGDSVPKEMIRPMPSGQLSVIFLDTDLELIRKIPIDRSKRLKEIKIWQRQNELNLVLTFEFEHFRYELSKIDQPKRLVLDVYRLAPPETTSLSEPEENAAPAAPVKKDDAPDAQPPADKLETTPESNLQTHSSDAAQLSPGTDRHKEPGEQQSVQRKEDASDQLISAPKPQVPAQTTVSEQTPAPKHDPPRLVRTAESPAGPVARPGRLQHYLVIGLVILTLVILVLLLVMLLSKNRWANSSSPIRPGDFLERQDERIAALDAKIQEQLKRYDKA